MALWCCTTPMARSQSNLSIDLENALDQLQESLGIQCDMIPSNDNDPAHQANIITKKVFGDVTKGSAARQFAIGCGSGWVAGYVSNKVGKTIAISVGSTLLLLQILQYNKIATVDWTRVRYAMTKARAKARAELERNKGHWRKVAYAFYEQNFFLASGFTGGFLFGFIL